MSVLQNEVESEVLDEHLRKFHGEQMADHPDAQAAERMFRDAEAAKHFAAARTAFDKLMTVCARMEAMADQMMERFASARRGDTSAPLERVATAAIALAEQVVAAFTERKP